MYDEPPMYGRVERQAATKQEVVENEEEEEEAEFELRSPGLSTSGNKTARVKRLQKARLQSGGGEEEEEEEEEEAEEKKTLPTSGLSTSNDYSELRKRMDELVTDELVKHARCALLPSPDLLTRGSQKGRDETNTKKDFYTFRDWCKEKSLLNTEFMDFGGSDYGEPALDYNCFKSLVGNTFSRALDAVAQTLHPTTPELVLWYYAGHGLHPEQAQPLGLKPSLCIEQLSLNHQLERSVQGGELCLHDAGHPNFEILYQVLAAKLNENSTVEKKNKNLLLILDSCFSGRFVKDLKAKFEMPEGEMLWSQDKCHITIQTACSANEPTFGGYFTPVFLQLQKDAERLRELVKQWETLDEFEQAVYYDLPFPSPHFFSTNSTLQAQHPTVTLEVQNLSVKLFPNPGFFKFCVCHLSAGQLGQEQSRAFNHERALAFLLSGEFEVLDYKLKKMEQENAYENCPLGLFLVKNTNDNTVASAHVHFAKGDVGKVGRVNLVECKKDPSNDESYVEDAPKARNKKQVIAVARVQKPRNPDDWEYWDWRKNDSIQSTRSEDRKAVEAGRKLLRACFEFVEAKEPGRWDSDLWNMPSDGFGFFGKFRSQVTVERETWMKEYLTRQLSDPSSVTD